MLNILQWRIILFLNGFIRFYDGTKYLVFFGREKYNAIYDRIRYVIGLKSGITSFFSIIQISKLIQMIICLWRGTDLDL